MKLTIDDFEAYFRVLYGYDPFPWQSRLVRRVAESGWPSCIDLPTASGKTALIDIAVFTLALQADVSAKERRVGRRVFFTVNRRIIVDQAYQRAKQLARALRNPQSDAQAAVAAALRALNENPDAPPLDVGQLRGGMALDNAWARSLTQPTVICTTADQLGSRLLFRGYGVSPGMRPIHAALCACDATVLLDEAHITRAFSQTLDRLQRYRRRFEPDAPPLGFVEMTATPARSVEPSACFNLADADRSHPVLAPRLNASKPARLIPPKRAKQNALAQTLAEHARQAVSEQRRVIAVMVNRVQTAREVAAILSKRDVGLCHLLIGRMRPFDADRVRKQLEPLVGSGRNGPLLEQPCFVVATQTLEVGADYDFDALITECASVDALRQRFGRLNRMGREIQTDAAIITTEQAMKDDDPIYGPALRETWRWLTEDGRETIDFGIGVFKTLWDQLDVTRQAQMLSPQTDAAVLLPAHLDALCQTAPAPEPSPDVSYFIHGPQRQNAEVQVCWRGDLDPARPRDWADIVRLLPPSSLECMTVPLTAVARWMRDEAEQADADVPVLDEDPQTPKRRDEAPMPERILLAWRSGDQAELITRPRDLRPGDTLVMPADNQAWRVLGHIPEGKPKDESVDIAEEAARDAHRRVVVRVHPSLWPADEQEYVRSLLRRVWAEERKPTKSEIEEALFRRNAGTALPAGKFAFHQYPDVEGQDWRGVALVCPPSAASPIEETDFDQPHVAARQVTLVEHTGNVVRRTASAAEHCCPSLLQSLFTAAASWHDLGKADLRFQALLLGSTPYEAMLRSASLAKSENDNRTGAEHRIARERAKLPAGPKHGFRHEMLSVALAERGLATDQAQEHRDLLLHLIAGHHGHARPFAPVVIDDEPDDDLLDIEVTADRLPSVRLSATERRGLIPPHRLDSGIADRFWRLTRRHGWWGLAYLEAVLRLADQQVSRDERSGS